MTVNIKIQTEEFDVADEIDALSEGAADTGAVASFLGVVRGDGGLKTLTLEHYPGMAESEIERHVAEANKRWALLGVTVVHRYGRIEPGENIVLVVTASSHRQEAFAAAEFLMDYLKTHAPFWKQVDKADGKSWVDAKAIDDTAAERWSVPRGGHEAAE